MSKKINQLISKWPSGAVRAISALKQEGYSQSLLGKYRYSGWLTSLGNNAVCRTGDEVSVLGALYALQRDLKLTVHLGGRSALELRGFAHYLRNERAVTTLYGNEARLPKWFTNYSWKENVSYKSSSLFASDFAEGLEKYEHGGFSVLISSSARAFAEYLNGIPGTASVEEAKEIMSGLTVLRPQYVQSLLAACRSVKVKRLFLLLAEECGHRWVERLDIDSIDLGTGPRTLIKGGKLHKKYRVTVPVSILSGENE